MASMLAKVESGFYVDVGGYDPLYLSNTYSFYRQGWSGVVVDANPERIKSLEERRPRDTIVHAAIGPDHPEVEFVTFKNGAFATLAQHVEEVPQEFRVNAKTYRVPQISLQTLFEGNSVKAIDFLNVDCEGSDLAVLETNDWARWRPRVVAVEDHGHNFIRSPTTDFLSNRGYELRSRAVITSIFERHE